MTRSIESGTYTMKATGPAKLVKSPEKGTPGIEVICQYMDGPNVGKTIEWIGWLTEQTIARTGESLGHMGYDGSDLSTVTRQCFQGVTEYETYDKTDGSQGERPRLKWINGASRMESMSPAEMTGAKDRLRAAMLAVKAKASHGQAAGSFQQLDDEEPAF
jgi:hypothetical protein